MRTETINLFSFDELSDDAKEKAREWYRDGLEYPWFDDAKASLRAFCDHFGIKVIDYCLSDDYRAFISTDAESRHFRGVKLCDIDRDAMPTGYCMDCSLWQEFHDVFKKTGDAKYAFEQALEQFLIDVRKDIEYQYSDECVDECLAINPYEFTEDGAFYS